MSVDYPLKPFIAPRDLHIDYRAELNDEQYAAVSSPPGPLLVIAGAGSGKTRTLTYRVAWLVEHGVDPGAIMLLTFTNKAAREMLRRVGDVLPHDISRMWGGTFHHVGHRLLRRHPEQAGLDKNFVILDREDSASLMASCLAESDVDTKDKRFPKAEVLLDAASMSVNTCRPLQQIINEKYPHFLELLPQISQLTAAYAARKLAAHSVDYDDLLAMPLRLLRNHPDILQSYQRRFHHILVDEYQDTNQLQADLIDLLAATHHQVMVVGDDAQSIYSWRGANFANIMDFPQRHDGTRVIRIETNYRSTPEILGLANQSISQNTRQFPKELRSIKDTGAKPILITLDDSRQQAMFVAQRVLELRDEGIELSSMAVLYRAHYHSMELQMELTRRNIPFQITSGLRFFEQAHIKDISAYLRLALNPADEAAFKRLALLLPGVGARTAHKLWSGLREGRGWKDLKAPAKAASAWNQWADVHHALRQRIHDDSPDSLLHTILESVYEDHLKAKYPNYQSRLEDIRQLQQFATGFENCADFLAQLSLMTNVDAEAVGVDVVEDECIKLSSIHQAKGLEWDVVFVPMLCDGMFPSARSLETIEGEEEERRLFYVAVTRAREQLYLLHPNIKAGGGGFGDTWQRPSRFLEELSTELCTRWNIRQEAPQWDDEEPPF